MFTTDFATIALKLFIIMDGIGLLPLFLMLSEKLPKRQRAQAADKTVVIASVLLILFVLAGQAVLDFFGITLPSFQIGGGIILLLFGLKSVLGLSFEAKKKHVELYQFTAVPMATPLLVGPGTITIVIIMNQQYNMALILLAAILNLFILWLVLRHAGLLYKIIGHQGSEVVSRMMGLVVTAWAVDFIQKGIFALIAIA
jgi:multiple antibiotic resistance protein